jgi:imidazolonepropionase-like amidohydrolase
MVDGPIPVWPFAMRVGTAAAGQRVVAAIAVTDADFVKVYTLLPREAFFAIADAANKNDLPVAGHVPISVTAIEASDAGQHTVEHYSDSLLPYCTTIEDEVLAELREAATGPEPVQSYAVRFFAALPRILDSIDPMKIDRLANRFATNQTWFTPTLIIGFNAAETGDPARIGDPRLRLLPPEVVASWIPPEDSVAARPAVDPELAQRSLDTGAAITRSMQQAGVPLLTGTDLGLPFVYPGSSLHDELALLVDAGLTPLAALQAATRNPAQAVGFGDDLGTVEVGKLADLVLLEADPLVDIGNTTRIATVIANRRRLERAEIDGILQEAERAGPAIAGPMP